ncbi:MAG TPA: thioesterase family protein [Steroidobacteraceae bacterium]|nr:thioesterase family protein [Steroidobacteraceae bacterium]
MAGTPIYRSAIQPGWIDYNGHLRDAYYVVVLSDAIDALMERVGIGADYRARTRNTLYTLEMHMHWLEEVKAADTLEIDALVLAADQKRLHIGCDVRIARQPQPVATAEFMLLHVHQGERPGAAPFPPEVQAAIERLRAAADGSSWPGPRSRELALKKR